MSETKYPVDLGVLCPIIQVTAEQAQRIGVQCAKINVDAAREAEKEATKPKNYDVGRTRNGNIVVHDASYWRYTNGTIASTSDCPDIVLFNARDVLEQGPIVIGMTKEEACGLKCYINKGTSQFDQINRIHTRIQDALERNK